MEVMDELNRQSDYALDDMNDHMDDHQMNDQFENDLHFQDDLLNNDF